MEVRPKAILCLCHDTELLQVRRMLLEHFGYFVLPSSSVDHARQVAETECPDMLLMDNSDSDLDFEELAKEVKQLCPDTITVLLSPYYRIARNGSLASIDRFVMKDEGPDMWIGQIAELLRHGGKHNASSA